jgi:hypothetical protein
MGTSYHPTHKNQRLLRRFVRDQAGSVMASGLFIEKAWLAGIPGSYVPLQSHPNLVNTHNFSENYSKMPNFSLNKSRIYP